MPEVKVKRVYDPYGEGDGLRVLVDRLWPRGVKKENLHYDMWEKEIAPSNDLRKWAHADMDNRWNEFAEKYGKELAGNEELKSFVSKSKGFDTVTLLYAAKDEIHNNALVLKSVLDKEYKR